MKSYKLIKTSCLILMAGLSLCFSAAPRLADYTKVWEKGTPQQIKAAIKLGADVNTPGKNYQTPLMLAAAYNNNVESIKYLLDAGADVNGMNPRWETPLWIAARYTNNPEIITILAKAGASLDEKYLDYQKHVTSLMIAISDNKNIKVINSLIEIGFNVNYEFEWRSNSYHDDLRTPLM